MVRNLLGIRAGTGLLAAVLLAVDAGPAGGQEPPTTAARQPDLRPLARHLEVLLADRQPDRRAARPEPPPKWPALPARKERSRTADAAGGLEGILRDLPLELRVVKEPAFSGAVYVITIGESGAQLKLLVAEVELQISGATESAGKLAIVSAPLVQWPEKERTHVDAKIAAHNSTEPFGTLCVNANGLVWLKTWFWVRTADRDLVWNHLGLTYHLHRHLLRTTFQPGGGKAPDREVPANRPGGLADRAPAPRALNPGVAAETPTPRSRPGFVRSAAARSPDPDSGPAARDGHDFGSRYLIVEIFRAGGEYMDLPLEKVEVRRLGNVYFLAGHRLEWNGRPTGATVSYPLEVVSQIHEFDSFDGIRKLLDETRKRKDGSPARTRLPGLSTGPAPQIDRAGGREPEAPARAGERPRGGCACGGQGCSCIIDCGSGGARKCGCGGSGCSCVGTRCPKFQTTTECSGTAPGGTCNKSAASEALPASGRAWRDRPAARTGAGPAPGAAAPGQCWCYEGGADCLFDGRRCPQSRDGRCRCAAYGSGATEADEDGQLPRNLRDPAFDRYVDLGLLGRAWTDLDAGLLADVGLQLAEGERVLNRPHRAIDADTVLALAVRVAEEKRDRAALDRIGKAVSRGRQRGLIERVAAAQEEVRNGTDGGPVQVSVDQVSPAEFAEFRAAVNRLRAARILGDADALRAAAEELPGLAVPAPSRKHLQRMAEDALAGLPKGQSPDRLVQVLNGVSRMAWCGRTCPQCGAECRYHRGHALPHMCLRFHEWP